MRSDTVCPINVIMLSAVGLVTSPCVLQPLYTKEAVFAMNGVMKLLVSCLELHALFGYVFARSELLACSPLSGARVLRQPGPPCPCMPLERCRVQHLVAGFAVTGVSVLVGAFFHLLSVLSHAECCNGLNLSLIVLEWCGHTSSVHIQSES